MGELPLPDPRELRVSDQDRHQVGRLLGDALGAGRLTAAEHADRLAAAFGARTFGELDAVTRDLPEPAGRRAGAPEQIGLVHATLPTTRRGGRWRAPAHIVANARFGTVVLDLRDAVLPHPQLEITADSFCGTIEILVPDDAVVTDSGTAFAGRRTLPATGSAAGRARPRRRTMRATRASLPACDPGLMVRISGHSAFGGVRVSRPSSWWPDGA